VNLRKDHYQKLRLKKLRIKHMLVASLLELVFSRRINSSSRGTTQVTV